MSADTSTAKRIYASTQKPRYLPHLAAYLRSPARGTIYADVLRWRQELGLHLTEREMLFHLLTWYPEFRSLFYFRLGHAGQALSRLAKGMPTLHFAMDRDRVGPGLFVQHGFATIVSAERIGENCWINQQVTIGYSDGTRCPVIEDDVTVGAGAIIIGDVVVGAGSTVGAGAVVVSDVPPDSVVVGVPARTVNRAVLDARDDGRPEDVERSDPMNAHHDTRTR